MATTMNEASAGWTCRWCGEPFDTPYPGGENTGYCSPECRSEGFREAQAQAEHQAQQDRDREPDRWPAGTRRRCPWCGDHFRSPGYPSAGGLETYCSPGCKRAAWHDDADADRRCEGCGTRDGCECVVDVTRLLR